MRISGVRGEPPTGSLKVSLNMLGGFRNDLKIAVCAPNIEAKAEFLERAFWDHCPYDPADYSEASSRLIRTDKPDPKSNEEAIAIWAMTLKDPDKRKVGRAVSDAVVEMALSTTPGFFMLSGPPGSAKEFGIHASALVAAEIVDQHVTFLDGEDFGVDGSALSGLDGLVVPDEGASAKVEHGPTTQASLGSVVGARSGDKGGDANLGVFATSAEAWLWLDDFLTIEMLRELLPEIVECGIDRYRLPLIRSLNFVIHGLLGQGVAATSRQDGQAKSLGEWLRSRVVDVPVRLQVDLTK